MIKKFNEMNDYNDVVYVISESSDIGSYFIYATKESEIIPMIEYHLNEKKK